MNDAEQPLLAREVRLQARFWQSPFALIAAIVVTSQIAIIAYGHAIGRAAPFDVMSMLTVISAMLLAAGIWPTWNFLQVDSRAIEQHAGLTGLKVSWRQVKSLVPSGHGVELVYVVDGHNGPVVRRAQVMNRYGLSAERFCDVMTQAWLRFGTRLF
ncbi:hypothetical protein [Parvularcula sp. LCG005]|uniref:hypothetical protein n=1 Tax=Parvularcula sp. LCG005 TaxID=3078805 RepID=UPI002941C605|nr:hypothetical protein [Parvularcula sp. LCG005]WOI53881.1 hypothetical protein RUI03_02500 [Parvularcula sp. LCG005]